MNYEITGNIPGKYAYPATVKAFLLESSEFRGEGIQDDFGNYQIDVDSKQPHFIILQPKIGRMWHQFTVYHLESLVFPENISELPFYFKCVGAGVSGRIQPDFTSDPLRTFIDNKCRWELVERIPPALVQYPIMPTIKV